MSKGTRIAAVLATVLLLGLPVLGQTSTGTLSGNVVDTNGEALPGVTVSLSGANLLGTRTQTTDAEGSFRFVSLPPGSYEVAYHLEGFSPVEEGEVTVRIATETQRRVTMSAGVAETIVVTGERVVVDTTKSTVDTAVDWELIDTLATNRTFQSVMELAPGVQVNANNPQVHGAASTDNLYLVDGVDTTDPRTQTWGTAINFDTIQEVQVQTAGVAAEFGRVTGGVVNLVTKSGGNELHGIGRVVVNDVDWTADPKPGTAATTASDEVRPSLSLGGPFVRDRFWFFGAYEGRDREQTFPRESGSDTGVFNTDVSTYEGYYASAKLTLQANPNHSIIAYYNTDPIDISNAWARYYLGPSVDSRSEAIQEQGGYTAALNWTGIFSPTTFAEIKGHSYNGEINVIPQGAVGPEPTFFDFSTGWWSGTTLEHYESERTRDGLNAALSQFLETGLGDHQLKFGVDYLQVENTVNDVYYPQGSFVLTSQGAYAVRFDNYNRQGPLVTENPYLAVYAQDSWKMDRLTVNLGLRAEQITLENNVGEDVLKFDLQDQLAPRLGFAYDLNGNSVHGSASRFYDIVSDYVTAGLNENRERQRILIWLPYYGYGDYCTDQAEGPSGNLDSDCWFEVDDYGLFTSNSIDRGIDPTYTDEITLGYDHRLTSDMSAGINFIWREQKDALEDFDDGTRGDVTPDDNVNHYSNVDGAWKKYQALELVVRKRLADDRVQFITSYTYQIKNEGFSSGSQLSGFADTSLSVVNRYGDLDTPHLFKLDGSYTLPWGNLPTTTTLGLSGFYYSGPVFSSFRNIRRGSNTGAQFADPDLEVGSQYEIDLHLEQDVSFLDRFSFALYADALNVTNQQRPTLRQGNLASAAFGRPRAWQTPRRYQFGAKFEF